MYEFSIWVRRQYDVIMERRDALICGGVAAAGLVALLIARIRSKSPSSKGALQLFELSQSAAESISMADTALISGTEAWRFLKEHVADIEKTHLRDLLKDETRCEAMTIEFDGIILDYSRQRVTQETVRKLFKLAEAAHLKEKIDKMYNGERINITENRSVLHIALRAAKDMVINSDGKNVVHDVWKVLDKIDNFSYRVRSGAWVGATGKSLKDVVAVGIGGSFLGPLFVHTALQTEPEAAQFAKGRRLQLMRTETLEPAESQPAVAENRLSVYALVKEFGIDPKNAFAFWDWVGGRYSVCSAVGVLPLSLQYGFSIVSNKFLEGAFSMDCHFHTTSIEGGTNSPVLLGLLNAWNVSFLEYLARAILPYCQALEKFAPHIQQLSMESNGKGVSIDGIPLPYEAGEIDFGEPGTNGQHSFYQLIHQGRIIPCDFIGIIKSQQPVYLKGEVVSNHDELMSNFFAQPDALAYGKTPEELRNQKDADHLITHETFSGNRPSLSILLPSLTAYTVGQLLAMYEHRIAVQGFIWGINSFDQWGVELGKSLASRVRTQLNLSRTQEKPIEGFNYSTKTLMKRYLKAKSAIPTEPCDLLPSNA